MQRISLAVQLSWGDSGIHIFFLENLEDYIRNEMVGRELPKILDAAIQLALDINIGILS